MCEFCNNPYANRDANHVDFAGFFSAEAIEAAVAQARAERGNAEDGDSGDDDSDGT